MHPDTYSTPTNPSSLIVAPGVRPKHKPPRIVVISSHAPATRVAKVFLCARSLCIYYDVIDINPEPQDAFDKWRPCPLSPSLLIDHLLFAQPVLVKATRTVPVCISAAVDKEISSSTVAAFTECSYEGNGTLRVGKRGVRLLLFQGKTMFVSAVTFAMPLAPPLSYLRSGLLWSTYCLASAVVCYSIVFAFSRQSHCHPSSSSKVGTQQSYHVLVRSIRELFGVQALCYPVEREGRQAG